ncbi:protease YdgD [Thioclava dalianensis]|nr:serine protease [Thioclava dalianensis]SFM85458.1 protease YdgD [Thioclava dalianensis]
MAMIKRSLIALTALFVLGQSGAPAQAETGLDRLSRRADLFGWEAVGKVRIGANGYCTGVLIAPDLVLTAGHCIFDRTTRQARAPADLTFLAGQTGAREIASRPVARMIADPAYAPFVPISVDTIRHDVALLQLATPIPSSTAAWFRVGDAGGKGAAVSVVSYARGRSGALSWQRDCTVFGHAQGLIGFDCDVDHGSSGAPVFDRSGVSAGQRAQIVSLVSSGARKDGKVQAYGMELPAIVAQLKANLRSGRGVIEGAPEVQTGARQVRPQDETPERTGQPRILRGGGSNTGAKFLRP